MHTKVFFEHPKTADPPLIDRKRELIENQRVTSKRKNHAYIKRRPSNNYFTAIFKIFKQKKRTICLLFMFFIVFFSLITLSVNMRSYVWEKKRILNGEPELLYELFLVEGFTGRVEHGSASGEKPLTGVDTPFVLPTLKMRSYTVKSGDSLFSIARTFNVSIDAIISANSIKNAYFLQIGTELRIPNMSGIFYRVQKGDSLSGLWSKYRVSINEIADINELGSSVIHVGQMLFIPGGTLTDWERAQALGNLFQNPAGGRLTSKMGFRTDPFTGRWAYHSGIDIANVTGAPVYAVQYGRVTHAGYKGNFGKTVIIRHPEGYTSLYAHLEKVMVKKAQIVKKGQIIATLGDSGRSTGPHLHFEIHQNNKILDPLKILRMGHR